MQHIQSSLRCFGPVFSLLCIVMWILLNWSLGENLWACSPSTASQLSAGQRAAWRFAWSSMPGSALKPNVSFKAAAKAVGMQCNISLHEMASATLIYFPLHFILQYLFFICLDHGVVWRWCMGCPFAGKALSQHLKLMEIRECHPVSSAVVVH